MFQIERHEKLIQYINEHKKANVNELSEIFGVSKVTIRRDLDDIAGRGLIIKTHGGAMSISNHLSYEIPSKLKSEVKAEEKKRLGKAAASLVDDGDIIIMDTGTTILQMIPHLNQPNIKVLTNDIKIAIEAAMKSNIELHVSGGMLNENMFSLAGPNAAHYFKEVHVNKAFLGCDAIDLHYGITNRTLNEIEVKRAMIRAAAEVILVTDSSKLNKRVFSYLCEVEEFDKIIIDEMNDDMKREFESKGIEVIIAEL